jgi:ADP-heptose:LPS heptosyltransferase
MTSFAEIETGQLRVDCRHYTGYKPCHRHDGCPGCPAFEPRGNQALLVVGEWGHDALRARARALRSSGNGWIVVLSAEATRLPREQWAELGVDEWRVADDHGVMALDGRPWMAIERDPAAGPFTPFVEEVLSWQSDPTRVPTTEDDAGRVLVIKLGAMGDVLRSKVILDSLRRAHPEWRITWLTEAPSLPLLDDERIDEVLPWNGDALRLVLSRRYQRVYCLDKDAHAVALARRVKAGRKLGFAPTPHNTLTIWNPEALHALRLGLSDELKFYRNEKSAQEIVADACQLPFDDRPYRLRVPPAVRGGVAARLRAIRRQLPAGCRLVGLNTGCGPVFATKAWTAENMAEFVRQVSRRDDLAILLLGGAREEPLHRDLMAAAGEWAGRKVFDSGNENSLVEFFALVGGCDAVASSDSLAMHVAIALGVPVVAWFGSTCHQEVMMYGNGEKLVSDFACSPCYLRQCPKPVFCMSAITPAAVVDAIDRVLNPGQFS